MLLARVVVTVMLPLLVVLAEISNFAKVPVPLRVCADPVANFNVKAVFVKVLFNVKLPEVLNTPAPAPVISAVASMSIPPDPMSVVNAADQEAEPPVLMVSFLAEPGLPSMVTEKLFSIKTSSDAVGIQAQLAPPDVFDQVPGVLQLPEAIE